MTNETMPAIFATVPADRIVDVDVREELRAGEEPFARIMGAKNQLADGEILRIRAIFEPHPLYGVLGLEGFSYWTEQFADDDWRVWFYKEMTEGMKPRELDVRVIPPREKHPAIFRMFDALEPGTDFILVNDHDPFPLRYQFEAERPNGFSWDYVEQGPVVWRVRIGKPAA